jgi:Fe-S oxidoreductase
MDAINEGEIPLNTATVQHFDSCLGCLACVTTCPSGVQYDKLIAATRPQIERNYPRSLPDKLLRQLIFSLFPYPNRLRVLLVPFAGLSKTRRTETCSFDWITQVAFSPLGSNGINFAKTSFECISR